MKKQRYDQLYRVRDWLKEQSKRVGFTWWQVQRTGRNVIVLVARVVRGRAMQGCDARDRRGMEAARQAVSGIRAMIAEAGLNPKKRKSVTK